MKVQRYELNAAIGKLKSVVPAKSDVTIMRNILVQDGYLIASDGRMTVRVRVPGTEGGMFLIPAKAFDVIANLPNGELEISPEKDSFNLRIGSIRTRFRTEDPHEFPIQAAPAGEDVSTIPADKLTRCIRLVQWAMAEENSVHEMMAALNLRAADGILSFTCLDGHVIAWDRIPYKGEFNLIIPRAAALKIASVGLEGEVSIDASEKSCTFRTDTVEVTTRIVEGTYYKYQNMFKDMPYSCTVTRRELLEAITRVRNVMGEDEKKPVRLEFKEGEIGITYIGTAASHHELVYAATSTDVDMMVGFNAKFLLKAAKSFEDEEITIAMSGPKLPFLLSGDGGKYQSCVLPVSI